MTATIKSLYRGKPKTLHDLRGEWMSSIDRQRADTPVEILSHGLSEDQPTQPYHGGPDAAICVHLLDHYQFWADRYGIHLKHGGLGENFLLNGITENEIFAGDIVRTGTALLQVSGPRIPCANQARHVGRSDWVKLTVTENRTGFYMRVLKPGLVSPGATWQLEHRPNEIGSISSINRCFYLDFNPDFARIALTLDGLGDWWRQQFAERLKDAQEHWSQTMSH